MLRPRGKVVNEGSYLQVFCSGILSQDAKHANDCNQRIGTATRDLSASWFPRFVAPLAALFSDDPNRKHPHGYELDKLGPPDSVQAEKRQRAQAD